MPCLSLMIFFIDLSAKAYLSKLSDMKEKLIIIFLLPIKKDAIIKAQRIP